MNIVVTDKARNEFLRLRDLENKKDKSLRLYVDGGGCSGLSYGMVFDEKRSGDASFWFDKLEVVIDNISIMYLTGIEIDFNDGLMGGFRINNPNAKQSCGCGTSFST
jgi:iron-sulfur cluster assembly accessory protein